jgi:hypothetical protein
MTAANSQKKLKRIDQLHDGIDPWSVAAQERATREQNLKIAEADRADIHQIAASFQVIDANFATYECHALKLNGGSLRHTETVQYRSIAVFAGNADETATKTDPKTTNSNNSSVGPADKTERSEIVFHDGPQEFFQVFFPFQNNDRVAALRKPLDYKQSNVTHADDELYCARIHPVTAAEAANLNS